MIGVPNYIEPSDYKTPNGSWEPEEEGVLEIRDDLSANMTWGTKRAVIRCDVDDDRDFWAIVHYCREYGVPGCWKSLIDYNGNIYRLGGLYIIAGFELTERETNYDKYGEVPYVESN